jgi:hypothetical protein
MSGLKSQRLDAARATGALAARMCESLEAWQAACAANASPAALSLAGLAMASAEAVKARAQALFARLEAGDEVPREDITALHRRLVSLNSVSSTVQQSTHPSLHPVLSPSVQSLLRDLKVEGQVLVSGADTLEAYELSTLRREEFEQLVETKALAAVKTWPFLVFTIPRPPLDWPLHYTLILHEIGHAVFAARNIGATLEIQMPPHLVNPLADVKEDSTEDTAKGVMMRVKQANDFSEMASSWIEELFADAFGVLLVGPAYVSAFCRVVAMSGRLDSATNTHPPPGLRIHLMARIVGAPRNYLTDLPDLAAGAIRGWFNEAEHVHENGSYKPKHGHDGDLRPLLPFLTKESERLHNELVKCAEAALGDRVHDVATQSLDIDRAGRLARLRVPIVERNLRPSLEGPGEPLDAARLLAGHWIAYYKAAEATPESEHLTMMSKYGDRLLGSLDAVEALRAWLSDDQ